MFLNILKFTKGQTKNNLQAGFNPQAGVWELDILTACLLITAFLVCLNCPCRVNWVSSWSMKSAWTRPGIAATKHIHICKHTRLEKKGNVIKEFLHQHDLSSSSSKLIFIQGYSVQLQELVSHETLIRIIYLIYKVYDWYKLYTWYTK